MCLKIYLDETPIKENIRLRERIDELIANERSLIQVIEDMKRKNQGLEDSSKRTYSNSSSSSNETVVTPNIHVEKINELTDQVTTLKNKYSELEERYEYEKTELQTMIEQLREDLIEAENTKQRLLELPKGGSSSAEEILRTQFEFELKSKLDEMRRILHEDHNKSQVALEKKYKNDLEQQSNEFHRQIEMMKIQHEKQIIQLNNEIDRLKSYGKCDKLLLCYKFLMI